MFAVTLLALQLATPGAPPTTSPPPPLALTLADAMARARTHAPEREHAAAVASGAEAAARESGRFRNPLITVQVENLGPPHAVTSGVPRDVFALATQPFEAPGLRGTRRLVAGSDRDTAALDVARVERQAALEAMRAYLQALRTRDNVDALVAARSGFDTLIVTMTARVTEGVAAEADRLRFLAEAARLDGEIARGRLELARGLSHLAVVLGLTEAPHPQQLVAPGAPAPAMLPAADALATAVDTLPEVRLAAARRVRAEQLTSLERLKQRPETSVTAGYKRTTGFNSAVAGVTLTVPIFDRNGEAIARAEGDASAAERDLMATRMRALNESRALLEGATTLVAHSTRMDRELLAPAEGVRNAARAMFREGGTDVLKLVDAERVYTDVQRDALAMRIDALMATIEARFAAGQETLP